MEKFFNFIEKKKSILKYYVFDWDDNVLIMPTKIYMEKKVNNQWIPVYVSTKEFSKVRKLDNWRITPKSFEEFGDDGPRGKNSFIEDVKTAIKNKQFGPSWDKFIECLTKGSIFAIITARGHEPDTIKNSVKWIIRNVLDKGEKIEMRANLMAFNKLFNKDFGIFKLYTFKMLVSHYLDSCNFIGVSSPSFLNKHKIVSEGTTISTEQLKLKALSDFINKVKKYGNIINSETRIGFSDDDPENIRVIKKYFGEISPLYKDIKFSIFDKSKKKSNNFLKRE